MDATKNSRGRGRPAQFDRTRAIEVAMRLFWQHGYDGVGVAELGHAIGINPPSLYHAFGSKAGLFREALAQYSATQGAFFAEAFASRRPAGNVLERMFRDAVEVYTADPKCRGCLIMNGVRGSEGEATDMTRVIRRRAAGGFCDLIRREAPETARELADYVMFVLAGLSAAAADGATRRQMMRNVDFAMEGIRRRLSEAPM